MTTSSVSRRQVLRGAAVGALGLTGAALIGCGGGDDGGSPATNTGGGAPGADSGAPKNIKRADGYNPALGEVAINTKKVIRGGTYRESASDTSRENDPDISISGADWQHIADRLVIANGWTMAITPDMLTSYELVDKQGLEMVFKLRPGIKTHNKPPSNDRTFT